MCVCVLVMFVFQLCKKCQKVLARYSKKEVGTKKEERKKRSKERTKLCPRSVGWFHSGKEAGKDSDKTDKETKF